MTDATETQHFLVIAAASRGARFFIKNALRQGHSVTALCRAEDDAAALQRMETLLENTHLAAGGTPAAAEPGTLRACNKDILDSETYRHLLTEDSSITRICCFVGVTSIREMMRRDHKLYTKTITALVKGIRQSRWVEFYYHGSSGLEGPPGQSVPRLPENFRPRWLMNLGLKIPAAQDCFDSESILADAATSGMKFVVFRPAWLTTAPAHRSYGFCFDTTSMDHEQLPLKYAKTTISREDVAEEILRVATLADAERTRWFGHGIYLVDKKSRSTQ